MSCCDKHAKAGRVCPTESSAQNAKSAIYFPGTFDKSTPWKFYNHLIAEIPEDVTVTDYCLGSHWSYVDTTVGMGVAWTCPGGTPRVYKDDMRGMPLKQFAELAKSWNFHEATLGVAALNAWYSREELLLPMGAVFDPADDKFVAQEAEISRMEGRSKKRKDAFDVYRPLIEAQGDAQVTVVGHFPHVDRIAEYANLTVLERNCRDGWDTPDPACEYVMPVTDYAFMTGVTIINKTAPRLLDLTKNAHTIMVGPSTVPAPYLMKWGVELMAGSMVADPEKCRFAVQNGAGQIFGSALQMFLVKSSDCPVEL